MTALSLVRDFRGTVERGSAETGINRCHEPARNVELEASTTPDEDGRRIWILTVREPPLEHEKLTLRLPILPTHSQAERSARRVAAGNERKSG